MDSWKCDYCKKENDYDEERCEHCGAYYDEEEDEYMECKKKMHKKVYTSGPISNSTAGGAQAAQELWVSATGFDNCLVKVEVLNWGDPAVSAGLTTTPPGMAVPMKAMVVPVMPAEKVKVTSCQTQHFFADLLTGGPLATPVLSFEIRVTVMCEDLDAKVLFNAVAYSAEAAEPVVDELDVLGLEEEEEEPAAGTAVTTVVFSFKDFVMIEAE
ncbi:hypothetical protein RRU94_23020 [Domibacillus sp. DTU_2020_1001157_1_SI_ALB_TIR_016]|uniref:hypothetical protein n=1 Tax=Domibacillus sp. DTU_2020_1001157_1_SI_ALB_TIR_016 TaxID=3077789 RepID=UPI0028EBF0A8|nr:hypothetical protein [Domibacillus sp. DTU_2020_1001157_1_SI_ALB_TIR_016]WNS80351.1 hypothetical protein RRU94_23020 [Domibacillus sp. DTU_2020_1001157_1_SI_ALB_TIR_016]